MAKSVAVPMICLACTDANLIDLPVFQSDCSMLSDGRMIEKSLTKVMCRSCGLVSHQPALKPSDIRAFYDGDYDLGVTENPGDAGRGHAYAKIIIDLCHGRSISKILELGCGAGHTLRAMTSHWPQAQFSGLEAAPQLASGQPGEVDRIEINQGFAEDLPTPDHRFDLVYAINVIEHAADPQDFLHSLRRQVAEDGIAVIICPRPTPANLELLFQDHVHSFTESAFAYFARRARFDVLTYVSQPEGLGDFHAFLLKPVASDQGDNDLCAPARPIVQDTIEYLKAWTKLDDYLLQQIGTARYVYLFGAGEVAAILRTYTPRTWSKVDKLIVDDLSGARNLNLPVMRTVDLKGDNADVIIVATHPRSQLQIAARLNNMGHRTVVFCDMINR
jgi:SAM-dependent methyltransferase